MFIHYGMNTFSTKTGQKESNRPQPITQRNWTATNGYGWPEMPVSAMFCSSPSITTGSACGTANIPTTMWLPHPSRRMWWVKCPKPAKIRSAICHLLFIVGPPRTLYKGKDFGKYIDYMQNQLTELLTHYGPVQEIWFDGGWDKKPEEWQLPRIYSHIKKLQPHVP